ncbi:MAG: M1 family metallopeptidase [Bacteroidota bacterium]
MFLRQLTIIIILIFGCKSTQIDPTTAQTTQQEPAEEQVYDVLALEGTNDTSIVDYFHPIKDYRATRSRTFDLLHTKLELSFDWEKQYVFGKATLKLTPYFYPRDLLVLDARSMEVKNILLMDNTAEKELEFDYVNDQIFITLDKTYTRNEDIIIVIDYVAKPNEISEGGSQAISSDKGLYFINPSGEDPYKPRQIWTQGETQASSAWFPTIDSPNEKTTQEVYLTVADTLTTLSNGVQVSSVNHNDGTKTDYWRMDKEHAPYLFMIAVGDFIKISDQWRDIELGYYVEPEYEQSAKAVFGNTPEMIEYFSKLLNYPYPWPQYNQVVVRDFVSGAMENTTATVFMEDLNVTEKELLDENWDYIIAHELFHHWFGDLVTCESWSNLTLNESFADFSEALWIGHKYGEDEGDYHAMLALENYFEEAEEEVKDLIRFYYDDKEDMFDRHSYEKGGAVLRMLKTYIGDEAFYAALNLYLKKNAYQTVEIHDLRLAFEAITGEDLNWFFNQWFLNSGHPVINVEESYRGDTLILKVSQVQNFEEAPLFNLPIFIDFFKGDEFERFPVVLNSVEEEIKIPLAQKPDLILFDGQQELVGEINYEQSKEALLFQLKNVDKLVARYRAFEQIATFDDFELMKSALEIALKDQSFRIITLALDFLQSAPDYFTNSNLKDRVMELTQHEKSAVRAGALYALLEFDPGKFRNEILKGVSDSSYGVQGVALEGILLLDSVDRDDIFKPFISENQIDVLLPTANYVNTTEDDAYFDWYQERLMKFRSGKLFYFIQYYAEFIIGRDTEFKQKAVPLLKKIAMSSEVTYTRYSAYQILFLLSDDIDVENILKEIRETEQDEELSALYEKL